MAEAQRHLPAAAAVRRENSDGVEKAGKLHFHLHIGAYDCLCSVPYMERRVPHLHVHVADQLPPPRIRALWGFVSFDVGCIQLDRLKRHFLDNVHPLLPRAERTYVLAQKQVEKSIDPCGGDESSIRRPFCIDCHFPVQSERDAAMVQYRQLACICNWLVDAGVYLFTGFLLSTPWKDLWTLH